MSWIDEEERLLEIQDHCDRRNGKHKMLFYLCKFKRLYTKYNH